MSERIDQQCNETVWLTPDRVLNPTRNYFGGAIPLDPATQPNNPTQAQTFYTEEENGLIKVWDKGTFVNPPYGKILRQWCVKIGSEAARDSSRSIIGLLPCGSGRPGTTYWQDYILIPQLIAVCYVRGRLKFLRPDGTPASNNTYPSQILGFNVDLRRFKKCYGHLGKVVRTKIS